MKETQLVFKLGGFNNMIMVERDVALPVLHNRNQRRTFNATNGAKK